MDLVLDSAPVPSDYFGVLWALAGVKNALVLEHGATGTAFYNAVSFGVMNKQSPKGILPPAWMRTTWLWVAKIR